MTPPRPLGGAGKIRADSLLTRERLIVEAERLFAEHGLEGVSLRTISVAAGQSNTNAVQYHFGDKEGLVRAIFDHRLPAIIAHRETLFDKAERQGRVRDVRTLLEVLFVPTADAGEGDAGSYVLFLGRTLQHDLLDYRMWVEGAETDVSFRSADLLLESLDHLPEPIRDARRMVVLESCLHAIVDRQFARRAGRQLLPYEIFLSNLFDAATAAALAPASVATRAAIRDQRRRSRGTLGSAARRATL